MQAETNEEKQILNNARRAAFIQAMVAIEAEMHSLMNKTRKGGNPQDYFAPWDFIELQRRVDRAAELWGRLTGYNEGDI